jgi:hypothetical protein
MKKVISGILAFAVLLVPATTAQVYFDPQHSSAKPCKTTEVAIWVNATDKFQSGQINMSYDPTCANVTTWERNATNFPLGTWAHKAGNDRMGFVGTDLNTEEYQIGTLTIHCVRDSEEGCKTPLDFLEDSKLVDDFSNPVPAIWKDGTFECRRTPVILDTGPGDYPSIFGTHNGTITLNQTISVSKLYTYPCTGTGGHTEYIRLWNRSGLNVTAKWRGYAEDWHNVSFDTSFELKQGALYNYTIRTGSYPRIIHEHAYNATGGTITCTKFTDANGKIYSNRIPAIRLFR